MLVGVRPCAQLLGQLQSPPWFIQRLNLRSQNPMCVVQHGAWALAAMRGWR